MIVGGATPHQVADTHDGDDREDDDEALGTSDVGVLVPSPREVRRDSEQDDPRSDRREQEPTHAVSMPQPGLAPTLGPGRTCPAARLCRESLKNDRFRS